jgi:cytochrome c553
VQGALTDVASDGTVKNTLLLDQAVLPVDLALSPHGEIVAMVSAGLGFTSAARVNYQRIGGQGLDIEPPQPSTDGQPIAVAFDPAGDLLVQSREPARLTVLQVSTSTSRSIPLSTISRDDTGHDIFHAQAGGLVACASCHPEGGDDGHVWNIDGYPRRTASLRGTIPGTAPYHWRGDEADFRMLVVDVYSHRMSGAMLDASQMGALSGWVQAIPEPPAPSWVDAAAAQRGRTLFEGTARCSDCHSGPRLTNNSTMTIGTGGTQRIGAVPSDVQDATAFQVPPLVGVGWRTPLLHDGCAATIADRFGKCATLGHGSTSQLSAQDISDLGAYLESL